MASITDTLSRLGTNALNVLGIGQQSDDINEAIDILTTESYSSIYGSYTEAENGMADRESEETIPSATLSGSSSTTSVDFEAWDPRLSRVDGFVSTSKSGGHPVIVPFASATAAGAFYDLVFTIERSVADSAPADSEYAQYKDTASTSTSDAASEKRYADTGEDINGSEKIYMVSDYNKEILNDSDSYGIASLVNPYTLTKLCSGLVKTGDKGDLSVENHMYDVRDSRRFYGNVIQDGVDDVLSVTNPTTTNIITWSNNDKWGRTPYYFQDFVFCKYWNIIPNNRLITFRKYHAPVYDNLQFSSMYDKVSGGAGSTYQPFAPIATVLSYFGDDTGNTLSSLLSFTTGTNWQDVNADVHQVSGDTGSDPHALIDEMFTGSGGFTGATSDLVSKIFSGGNMLTQKMFSFGKFVGLLSPDGYNMNNDQATFDKLSQANIDPYEQLYSNKILGPVNRIQSTKARKDGIKFDQKFSLTCQYVARPIGGVNTKAAMLDILSNCMEIASVDAMFWGGGYRFNIKPNLYPFKNTAFKNRIMDDLYAGRIFGGNGALAHTVEGIKKLGTTDKNGNDTGSFDWSNITGKLGEFLGETLGAIGDMINSLSNTLFGSSSSLGDWLKGAGDDVGGEGAADRGKQKMNALCSNLNQMWRSKVIQKTMMPNVHGMKAILTGEPVGNWHLTVGNPLNPIMVIGNLICTDMKVEFNEELGPDDFPTELKVTYQIEHAMTRDKAAIQSMFNRGNGKIYQLPDWIRASSDYESKVDDFTGPSSSGNGSFYTPKYMNVSAMLAQGGGGGFQTYKMSSPKQLSVNSHTNSTIIAKFTPPDVEAAISNIKEGGTTFFGANAGSRAWIRGVAATRKLMN